MCKLDQSASQPCCRLYVMTQVLDRIRTDLRSSSISSSLHVITSISTFNGMDSKDINISLFELFISYFFIIVIIVLKACKSKI